MPSNIPGLIRIPVFIALIIFSLIVLGIDGHLISQLSGSFEDLFGFNFSFTAPSWTKLGVAVSVITMVSLIPMIVIDFLRRGAPTSWVLVELVWLGILWVLWLATAADTANNVSCSGVRGSDICSQVQAAEAFSFLAWIVLMAYWVLLLVFAIMAANKGHKGIWKSGVADADFQAAGTHNAGGYPAANVSQREGATPTTYPPHQSV